MKLNDDFDEEYDDPLNYNSGRKSATGTAAVIAVLFILSAVAIVVLANNSAKKNTHTGSGSGTKTTPAAAAPVEIIRSGRSLRSTLQAIMVLNISPLKLRLVG
ncbi:MAG: hypothetical protein J6X66_14825 [Lachnospiraceae bacterium]|nr:hypothetical protein [Lachnospiraceae bacterium]